jgi:hypothetical protein
MKLFVRLNKNEASTILHCLYFEQFKPTKNQRTTYKPLKPTKAIDASSPHPTQSDQSIVLSIACSQLHAVLLHPAASPLLSSSKS